MVYTSSIHFYTRYIVVYMYFFPQSMHDNVLIDPSWYCQMKSLPAICWPWRSLLSWKSVRKAATWWYSYIGPSRCGSSNVFFLSNRLRSILPGLWKGLGYDWLHQRIVVFFFRNIWRVAEFRVEICLIISAHFPKHYSPMVRTGCWDFLGPYFWLFFCLRPELPRFMVHQRDFWWVTLLRNISTWTYDVYKIYVYKKYIL